MAEELPVQHKPVHLRGGVFDERHPAASSFAVAQPAAGVVANDVPEKGQNLAGGPTADEASKTYSDQREVLAQQHDRNLRAAVGSPPSRVTVEGGEAKAVREKSEGTKSTDTRPTDTTSTGPAASPRK